MFDLYVVAKYRTLHFIDRFLTTWAKGFNEGADEYEFPQYADKPRIMYANVNELIRSLVKDLGASYNLYWINPNRRTDILSTMLFFTIDGHMITGVSTRIPFKKTSRLSDVTANSTKPLLAELAAFCEASVGGVL